MGRRRNLSIESRRINYMEFLLRFQKENGHSPSVREIGLGTQTKSPSQVLKILGALEEVGEISRDKNQARSIHILNPQRSRQVDPPGKPPTFRQSTPVFNIPLLGNIAAGLPVEFPIDSSVEPGADTVVGVDSSGSSVQILQSQLPNGTLPSDLYALRVKGDSMVDAMVNDGDIILVRPTQTFTNGDMVVANVGEYEGTTLKRIYREPYKNRMRIRLQPANANYSPTYFDQPGQVRVLAKMVMVLRTC